MFTSEHFFSDLSDTDIELIRSRAVSLNYVSNQVVFNEGDAVDYFYIVDSGRLSIDFDKNGFSEHISYIGAGEFFGEMAIFNHDRRIATVKAVEDSCLLGIDKEIFLDLIHVHPVIANKINRILVQRNEEFVLKECLLAAGVSSEKGLRVSIKGDPSLRETAIYRARHFSEVDTILPELVVALKELLLNRSPYKVFIAFNSGEVRLQSVFDPFNEEVHSARKLIDAAYRDRHFPRIDYSEKAQLIRGLYGHVLDDRHFGEIPGHWQNIISRSHASWQPVPPHEIELAIDRLSELRNIENFYLRNFMLTVIKDAIRLQFNCDGAHILTSQEYHEMLAEIV